MNVSTLRLADEPKLREWMLSFITDHIKWWNSFYKVSWTDEQIDHHIDKNELIHKSIDIPLYDTTQIHAAKAVEWALK